MKPTAGILYCGDLGAAFARLLRQAGVRVVTTCANRSSATRERAIAAGAEILPTLEDVVRQSELVFSLVLPTAAVDVARQYAARHALRPSNSIFVDVNSIGLETLAEIETTLTDKHDIPFVDATIHGGAQRLKELGVMYVSGPQAGRVAAICRDVLRVRPLGDQVGTATRMKLLIAGLSKSLNVLFLEIGVLAEQAGMLDEFLESCRHFYPGIMTAIDRMLPTYPQHAARRVGELQSIEQMAETCHSPSGMLHAAGELLQRVASVKWNGHASSTAPDVSDVIRCFAQACQPAISSPTTPEVPQ